MKRVLLILLLTSPILAAGPKRNFQDSLLNDELENIYHDIGSVLKGDVRISSVTIGTATIANLNVTTINGSPYGTFQASSQCLNTTNFSTASGAYQTTNLTCKITPSSTASRVRIDISGSIATGGAGQPIVSLFRGATDLDPGTNGFIQPAALAGGSAIPASVAYIDSPASASQLTYSVKLKSSNGATTVTWGDTQVMILEEIK